MIIFNYFETKLPVSLSHFRPLLADLATSPLAEFFPEDPEVLLHYKNLEWKTIIRLPFVKREVIQSAVAARDVLYKYDFNLQPAYCFYVQKQLTEEEKTRNSIKPAQLFKYNPATVQVFIEKVRRF